MFHEINHPAIGIAPFKETPQMVRPFKAAQRDPSSPPQLVLSDARVQVVVPQWSVWKKMANNLA